MKMSLNKPLTGRLKRSLLAPLTLAALLVGLPVLLLLSVAGAGADPAQAVAAAKGYRTCFMERRIDFAGGTPRLVKERRCVFAE
ncbi:hypothetical protein [Ancylobacter sp. TS-1]|uniref:hypothetical protein n=1 Tax=Ancylobacter sp. TS-1 TaxID=1850374 RepID=UPI001FF05998|nr:hypothetical protein [Ancylobacter sp. TS-1]